MTLVTKTVQVSESADKIGKAVLDIVKSAKTALADGWQPSKDVPAILVSATTALLSAMSEIPDVPADVAENKTAFIKGLTNQVIDIADLFV